MLQLEKVIQGGLYHWRTIYESNSFPTPWTVARQAPLYTGFPRQEYWSESPFPSSGDLPNPGIEPMSPALAGVFLTAEPPGKPATLSTLL